MDIVSRAEVAAYMGQTEFDASDLISQLIPRVSDRLASLTGRLDWGPEISRTEYFDGGTNYIRVNYWPIVSVTNIWDDNDHLWPDSSKLTAADYHVAQNPDRNGIVYIESGNTTRAFARVYAPVRYGFENVKITYTGGYANTAAIPQRIKTAALLQIKFDSLRGSSGSHSSSGRKEAPLVLPEVRDLLTAYTLKVNFA